MKFSVGPVARGQSHLHLCGSGAPPAALREFATLAVGETARSVG